MNIYIRETTWKNIIYHACKLQTAKTSQLQFWRRLTFISGNLHLNRVHHSFLNSKSSFVTPVNSCCQNELSTVSLWGHFLETDVTKRDHPILQLMVNPSTAVVCSWFVTLTTAVCSWFASELQYKHNSIKYHGKHPKILHIVWSLQLSYNKLGVINAIKRIQVSMKAWYLTLHTINSNQSIMHSSKLHTCSVHKHNH